MTLPQGSFGAELPRQYSFSECSTVAEALPDLVIASQVPRTAIAYYGNSALAIRDQRRDGLLCEHGCRVSILTANERLEQYTLVSRKASVESDREYKTTGGTAVYKTLFSKMEGDRWLALDIEYLNRSDGGRTYKGMGTGYANIPVSMTGTDMETKVAACLERP